ncbi:hypothetical protein A4D02_25460 [Niastella koreensis]|uniref:Uncharacterized protein n=2 Tax=Niastella koreensis TaxID=354356 RepID=G8TNK1_NIAKG|nr:hypothetical protein [Niastella koreensis]AEV99918.1 hypothetical protein Niako_3618 [Niastella koreensis GR20-10]OQP51473.1 hypothetical protein A4D02_25460 [Niastella koreensis]
MGLFKVLSLVKVGIIIIGNFIVLSEYANAKNCHQNIWCQVNSDTIKIIANDYKLLSNEKYTIKIEILNSWVLQLLKEKQSPVISFSLRGEELIARGNNITSSSVPNNCNLFYFMNRKGEVILYEDHILTFNRIGKVKVSS